MVLSDEFFPAGCIHDLLFPQQSLAHITQRCTSVGNESYKLYLSKACVFLHLKENLNLFSFHQWHLSGRIARWFTLSHEQLSRRKLELSPFFGETFHAIAIKSTWNEIVFVETCTFKTKSRWPVDQVLLILLFKSFFESWWCWGHRHTWEKP